MKRPDLVDFHCHLDLYPDLAEAVASCDQRRVATLAVTTTPRAFEKNREIASRSSFVRVAIGLHPQLVWERATEVALFEHFLSETRYVGEVGLDASPAYYKSIDKQVDVFTRILKSCARAGDKILSIHSVRAVPQVLGLLKTYLPRGRGTPVLHWFTGSTSQAKRALEFGCYFSMNERMLSSPNGRKIAQIVPLDRILTETDGPFVERQDGPISPGDVATAIGLLASVKQLETETMRQRIVTNLSSLLS